MRSTAEENALIAQIERKIVRAPFPGKLGIRLVNVGQYLPPGTPITVLESDESVYVDFTLPQQNVGQVAVGMPVRLSLERGDAGAAELADGKIYAVEPAVDPATRNIRLRASVPPEASGLRPGMFVKAGDEVVTAGAFKLRNRATVVVNDEVETRPEMSPHPPNR